MLIIISQIWLTLIVSGLLAMGLLDLTNRRNTILYFRVKQLAYILVATFFAFSIISGIWLYYPGVFIDV